jgi:hypothetical protein
MVSHWVRYDTEEPFVPNLDKFGFVYIITNTKTTKAYVGCKQYFMGKKKAPSKWEMYTGSSKYLNADIEEIGKKHFTFEVIAEYKNKRSLRYYEAYYQMKWDVLTSNIEGSDEPAFYNSYVGGKFYRPIESYEKGEDHFFYGKKHTEEAKNKMSESHKGKKMSKETKRKMSEAKLGVPQPWKQGENHRDYKGKAEFYLEGKRMVVDCLGAWANKNGYNKGALSNIARTTKNGFVECINIKGGPKIKRKYLSCKGPLGTITKVRWLGKEVKDVTKESNV